MARPLAGRGERTHHQHHQHHRHDLCLNILFLLLLLLLMMMMMICLQVKVTCASSNTSCVWSGWAEWGTCSVSCNSGTQVSFVVTTTFSTIIIPCKLVTQVRRRKELQGEVGCAAGEEEERECGAGECPRDCRWGSWGTWDPCSVTCGKGTQK